MRMTYITPLTNLKLMRAEGVAADCAFGFCIHTAGVLSKSWLARWIDEIEG